MGYFEKLSGGASRPVQAVQEPKAPPAPAQEAQSVPQEVPAPVPAEQKPPKADAASVPEAAPATEDVKEASADDAERRAHEAAEAKRKAEWEAEKRAQRQAQLDELAAMSDEDAIKESMARVGADVERLTRRNMKEMVAEHIQAVCRRDATFARRIMLPGKNMVNCFKYITRKAREYVKQEMEDNDVKPDGGGYGCDVPDDLCYQWAVDYFDAPEEEKQEEFVSRPYVGKSTSKSKGKPKPKQEPMKAPDVEGQISFLGEAG